MIRSAARPWTLGLTGGIGSGKSAAATEFARLGAAIVDTDAISRTLTAAGGRAMPALIAAFGTAIVGGDGALDRAAMRQRAFSDAGVRSELERILHPLIYSEAHAQLCRLAGADFYAVLVVPLLVEHPAYREIIDRLAVVDCPESLQIARVMARSGLERPAVAAMLAAQATRRQRLAVADDCLDNRGDLAGLAAQVAVLHARNCAAAAAATA